MLFIAPTLAASGDTLCSQAGDAMPPRLITDPSYDFRPSAAAIPTQRSVIRLSLDYQIEDWCKAMRCSERRLREAVHAVGPGATAVQAWLRGRVADGELAC
jgi:hypothetical protein